MWAVLVGLLAVAVLPAGIAVAELRPEVELLDAAFAIPLAALGAVGTLWLARRARRRSDRTLGRVGGRRTATAGRVLGVIALCLSISGAIAVATYYALDRWPSS